MEFAKELYVGDGVTDLGGIVYALRRNLSVTHVYCLCREADRKPILILSANELTRAYNTAKNYLIFGLAKGKKEAYTLFADIVREANAAGYPVERLWDYLEKNGVVRDDAT